MRHRLRSLGLAAGLALIAAMPAAAQQGGGFVGRETRELVAVCAVPAGAPTHAEARAFCHGYLTGLYSTLLAMQPAGAAPMHCGLPQSRQEPVDRFVAWAHARPADLAAFPPNAFLRFMDETYACPAR